MLASLCHPLRRHSAGEAGARAHREAVCRSALSSSALSSARPHGRAPSEHTTSCHRPSGTLRVLTRRPCTVADPEMRAELFAGGDSEALNL